MYQGDSLRGACGAYQGVGVIWQRRRGVTVVHVPGCGVIWERQEGRVRRRLYLYQDERGVPVVPGVVLSASCTCTRVTV